MNILEKIISSKEIEVQQRKISCPVAQLEQSMLFNRTSFSFKSFITDPAKSGIIAEFKRKSPSRGIINGKASLEDVVRGYEEAGVSAISVLTDKEFFGGGNKDLIEARTIVNIPLLRKDFIIDEYQLIEAKSIGADVILLIAAALQPPVLKRLAAFAKLIGLEVLMEVHNEQELMENLHDAVDVIGVNNRNLKDFSESIETSIKLSSLIPDRYVKISESSLSGMENILKLKSYGYSGFLMGEAFMKYDNPGQKCRELIDNLKSNQNL
jgi:indole-3-glycerol phosphate synthase